MVGTLIYSACFESSGMSPGLSGEEVNTDLKFTYSYKVNIEFLGMAGYMPDIRTSPIQKSRHQ